MSLIRRISATFAATVDRAVAKVENHDAVIESALRDARLAAARSRVRLDRLRRDGAGLESRRAALAADVEQWARRAAQLAGEDEARALDCLRRRRDCAAGLDQVKEAIASHRELEVRMAAEVARIDERIGEMSRQRNMLRSRQSVADAVAAISTVQGAGMRDIEDTFERWEITLAETEYRFGSAPSVDPLEATLRTAEETAALRAELAALVAGAAEPAQ